MLNYVKRESKEKVPSIENLKDFLKENLKDSKQDNMTIWFKHNTELNIDLIRNFKLNIFGKDKDLFLFLLSVDKFYFDLEREYMYDENFEYYFYLQYAVKTNILKRKKDFVKYFKNDFFEYYLEGEINFDSFTIILNTLNLKEILTTFKNLGEYYDFKITEEHNTKVLEYADDSDRVGSAIDVIKGFIELSTDTKYCWGVDGIDVNRT